MIAIPPDERGLRVALPWRGDGPGWRAARIRSAAIGVTFLLLLAGLSPSAPTLIQQQPPLERASPSTQPAASATRATSASPTAAPATQPATRPSTAAATDGPASERRLFRPGVWIDWQRGAVFAEARVVLNDGPLELLACFHSKEHESILRFECSAADLFMALGLSGRTPGSPPRWDAAGGRYERATGDLVDVRVEFEREGRTVVEPLLHWVREIEFDRPAADRPFVFAGSRMIEGRLAADMNGVGIAIVDQGESLLCLSRPRSDRNEELWAVADPQAVAPLGATVRVAFVAAAPVQSVFEIDALGAARIDRAYADPADFADRLRIAQQLEPLRVVEVRAGAALDADRRRWLRRLVIEGVDATRVKFTPSAPP
ncbi:MAG: hypothetical protein HRU75_00850 [Planctomycetia bacterium]|nr:MAG: hypothetical protein HRU75_00850 [Planctomycetia bacterium]